MTGSRLEHFLKTVGYPERAGDGVTSFTMRVDGMEILAEESGDRIVLSFALSDDPSVAPQLASYAAGRILHENAVLAYGRRSKGQLSTFLWQDAPADADARTLVRLFETFADSCDWWRARLEARSEDGSGEISEAVIRP